MAILYMTPYTLPIVGVTFGKRQKVIASIENGEPLFFKREPGNTYDPEALAIVTSNGDHVGYIGRNEPMRRTLNSFLDTRSGMLIARLCGKRGGYGKYSYGASVEFYAIPSDRLMLRWSNKEEPETEPLRIHKGKHPEGMEARRAADRKHKDNDMARNVPLRSYKNKFTWNVMRRNLNREEVSFKHSYTKELLDASKLYYFERYNSVANMADCVRNKRGLIPKSAIRDLDSRSRNYWVNHPEDDYDGVR